MFSTHVVDTGALKALRRKTPQADDIPGLMSARTATCAPFTKGVLPRPQFKRETMVACWSDEDALDRFLATDPTGRAFNEGWQVRMELMRAVGVWPGTDERMVHEVATNDKIWTGPTIAITIGTAYLRTLVPFLRVNNALEDQFLATPSRLWGTGFTNLPQLLVGTLTVWESGDAAIDYMKSGAHGAAVAAHFDPKEDPTGHTFVTGGGFFGFRPLSVRGTLGGKNPVPSGLLAAAT